MTMSAPFIASATSATLRPAFFALSQRRAALAQADGDLDARIRAG